MNVIEASGLGKRYGSTWALRECALEIPAGHVAALAGPRSPTPCVAGGPAHLHATSAPPGGESLQGGTRANPGA